VDFSGKKIMTRQDFLGVLDRALASRIAHLNERWRGFWSKAGKRLQSLGENSQLVEQFEPRLMMTASILDDGDAGYTTVGGSWTGSSGSGYQSDYQSQGAGSGTHKAVYSFTSLTPGQYRVSANWNAASGNASNTPYTITSPSDGKTFATVRVNQENAPDDFTESGTAWEDLGALVELTGTSLTVTISDDANETVIADGVRIERIGDLTSGLSPSSPSLTMGSGYTNDTTPTVKGTGLTGSTVGIYEGETSLGTGVVDGSGNYSITLSTLGTGSHTLLARAVASGGSVTAFSSGSTIVVDTSTPSLVGIIWPGTLGSAGPVSFSVEFSAQIDLATFTWQDLDLTRNSGSDLITSGTGISITHDTGGTYILTIADSLRSLAGNYQLTVHGSGITNLAGTAVSNDKSATYTVDPQIATLTAFGSPVSTPVKSVTVTFNQALTGSTFDWNDLSLTRDGGSNLVTSAVTVAQVSGNPLAYTITIPSTITQTEGAYQLSVTGSGIQSSSSTALVNDKSTTWTMQPSIASTVTFGTPFLVPVAVTTVTFNTQINTSTFDWNDLVLTRDGGSNLATSGITIAQSVSNPLVYNITIPTSLTRTEGSYKLGIIGAGIQSTASAAFVNDVYGTWTMKTSIASTVSYGTPFTTPVTVTTVRFNTQINTSTFDWNDLSLTRGGGSNLATSGITIAQSVSDPLTYTITIPSSLTRTEGSYDLGIIGAGIQSTSGATYANDVHGTWTMKAAVGAFSSISSPRTTAVTAVSIQFHTQINTSTFDWNDIVLKRDGGSNLATSGITIAQSGSDPLIYILTIPSALTTASGAYQLSVIGSGIQSSSGSTFANDRQIGWSMSTLQISDSTSKVLDATSSIDFGTVLTGSSNGTVLTLKNMGTGTLTLGTPSLTGPFTIVSALGKSSLGAGESTTITIGVDLSALGTQTGGITFTSGSPYYDDVQIDLTAKVADPAVIIDNGDTGFATVGTWTSYNNSSYPSYQGTSVYSASGTGADKATWTFSKLTPGIYTVYAVWSAASGRATDAPFTVRDANDNRDLGTYDINQTVAPIGLTESGTNWKQIGTTFEVRSDSLSVTLTDDANGDVFADGIRIQRVDELPGGSTEMQFTSASGNALFSGNIWNLGSDYIGKTISETFTITNYGADSLKLDGSGITVPSGYTLTTAPGKTTLASGESTTFTVTRDQAVGVAEGILSFGTNDSDEGDVEIHLYSELYAPAVYLAGTPDAVTGTSFEMQLNAFGFTGVTGTSWSIDWGDGTTTTPSGSATSDTHTYAEPGAYVIAASFITTGKTYEAAEFGVRVKADSVPAAPDDFDASISGTTATLTWENASETTQTRIEYSINGEPYVLLAYVDAGLETYEASGLFAGTKYEFRAYSINGVGKSSASDVDSVITIAYTPGHVFARVYSDERNEIEWDATTYQTGYKVYRSGDKSTWDYLDTTLTADYTDFDAHEGARYYYRVTAYNDAGESAPSAEAEVRTLPSEPTDVTAELTGTNTVTVEFKNTSGHITHYAIDRRTDLISSNWQEVEFVSLDKSQYDTSDGDTFSKEVTGNVGDLFRVRVVNEGGSSIPGSSGTSSSVAFDALAPDAPENLRITVNSFNSAWRDLEWDIVSGASFYIVQARSPLAANSSWVSLNATEDGLQTVFETFHLNNELWVWPTLELRVVAVYAGDVWAYSIPSEVITYTAVNTVPAPTNLVVVPGANSGSALFTWDYGSPSPLQIVLMELDFSSMYNVIAILDGSERSVDIDGLYTIGGGRRYAVYASGGGGDDTSVISDHVTIGTSSKPAPSAPMSKGVGVAGTNSALIQWHDKANNEVGYEIVRAMDGGSPLTIVETAADMTSYLDTTLVAGHKYSYSVRAKGSDNHSSFVSLGTVTAAQSTITVQATQPAAQEGDTASSQAKELGQIVFRRNGDTTTSLSVDYTLSGDAEAGVDFEEFDGSINFGIGQSIVVWTIDPIEDSQDEGEETLGVTIITSKSSTEAWYGGADANSGATISDPVAITDFAVAVDTGETNVLNKGYFDFFARMTLEGTRLDEMEIRMLVNSTTVTYDPITGDARTAAQLLADAEGLDRSLIHTNGQWVTLDGWDWQAMDVGGEYSVPQTYTPPVREFTLSSGAVTVLELAQVTRSFKVQIRRVDTDQVIFEDTWGYEWENIPVAGGITGTNLKYIAGESETDGAGKFSNEDLITGLP
jgi:hypothetical protein